VAQRFKAGHKATQLVLKWDDLSSYDEVLRGLESAKQAVQELADSAITFAPVVERRFVKPMLDELRVYPPRKPGMKIRWANARQRRLVMMKLRKQADERGDDEVWHHRTGEYGMGWEAQTTTTRGKRGLVRIRVYNNAGKGNKAIGQYIQGQIGIGASKPSIKRYREHIQAFHTDRGWSLAYEIVQKHFKDAREFALEYWAGIAATIPGFYIKGS